VSSILIAENDLTARGLLAGWLEDAGYVCATAETADALSRARQQSPAAALVTVTSIDDGGMWVLRTLSAHLRQGFGAQGDRDPIATVALTPTPDLAVAAAARRVGAIDCLPWPSSRATVLDSVRRALDWHASTNVARRRYAYGLEQLTVGRERLLKSVAGLDADAGHVVLLAALEAYNSDLYHHAHRVMRGAVALASALHVAPATIAAVRTAALLHDVGRIALPKPFAQFNGPTNDDDVAVWRMHVSVAEDVLGTVEGMTAAAPIVAAMHERFDGTGYPLGRAENAIPVAARIIAVVDAYDTLVSQRGFDGPLTHDEATAEIIRRAGTQFDPEAVRAWLEVGDPGRCF
jgi:response regulator RpfG family c-di-GMP phosphodiesterase